LRIVFLPSNPHASHIFMNLIIARRHQRILNIEKS
jgi:hypothetical protein